MEITTTYDTPLLTALERLGPHDHQSLIYENPEDRFAVAFLHSDRPRPPREVHLHR